MPSDIKPIALVIFATLAAACSGTPRTAGPAVGSAAQSNQAPQTLAAASNAPDTATTAKSDIDLSLVKAGYSVLRRHGEVFYCRNEIITGNRIASRVCLTAAQIQDEKQDVTKAKDLLNHPNNRACLAASCN
jgi:hypothetical protein